MSTQLHLLTVLSHAALSRASHLLRA